MPSEALRPDLAGRRRQADGTSPPVSPAKTSTALVVVCCEDDPGTYLRRVGALAEALDLAVEVAVVDGVDRPDLAQLALTTAEAAVIPPPERLAEGRLDNARAAFVAIRLVHEAVFALHATEPSCPKRRSLFE